MPVSTCGVQALLKPPASDAETSCGLMQQPSVSTGTQTGNTDDRYVESDDDDYDEGSEDDSDRDAYSCDDSDYEPNEESTDSDDDDLEQDPNE